MKKKKNIEPRNNRGEAHGLWELYWPNGQLWYKCFCHSDKRVGYGEFYMYNSKPTQKTYYL